MFTTDSKKCWREKTVIDYIKDKDIVLAGGKGLQGVMRNKQLIYNLECVFINYSF